MDEQARGVADGTLNFEGQQGSVRRRLGRGLSALLGSNGNEGGGSAPAGSPPAESRAAIADSSHVHVELIERNPFQPRKDFESEALDELVESVRQHGVLQPLLVRPSGGQYQLIAGERRLMAAKKAGLETVPCRVLELEDQAMCEAALEENLKRRDLNVLGKSASLQRIHAPFLSQRRRRGQTAQHEPLVRLQFSAALGTDRLRQRRPLGRTGEFWPRASHPLAQSRRPDRAVRPDRERVALGPRDRGSRAGDPQESTRAAG